MIVNTCCSGSGFLAESTKVPTTDLCSWYFETGGGGPGVNKVVISKLITT